MSCGLAAFYAAVILFAGCIPEDSLEWSQDGSIGLLRVEGALYLVDGKTGALTEIAKENIQSWPAISKNGNLIAYSQRVKCASLPEGLKVLPPGQVKMIQYYAEQTRKSILDAGGLADGKFPFPEQGPLVPDDYRNWAIRYVCENADDELSRILGGEGIKTGKEKEISYSRIVVAEAALGVAPSAAPDKSRVVAASLFSVVGMKFSPDCKFLAYLMHTQQGQVSNAFEEHGLYVASLGADVKAMLVTHPVAWGYDWRKDSRAIAYLTADSKDLSNENTILGTFEERIVADENGSLLTAPTELSEQGSAGTHHCTGKTASLAGGIFYPWLKVQYGTGERIFFSSCVLSLPASKKDEPGWSLFCYDCITGTVTDVLPTSVSNHTSKAMSMAQFALSPDGKNVVLPIKNNRLVGYTLGTDSIEIPIEQDEGFGEEDGLKLAPAWKGNRGVSFLVSENSHFLMARPSLLGTKTKDGQEKPTRKEIVVLEDGESRILSASWPDEIMRHF
jgi:hypothetical protein